MLRPWSRVPLFSAALVVLLGSNGFGEDPSLHSPLGFFSRSATDELKAESKALAVPTPERARSWLRTLTEEPHAAGTPADHKTALFVRDRLREWGWDAELSEYEVLLNYPLRPLTEFQPPHLELTRPVRKPLATFEDTIVSDKDSASHLAFAAFHGYGISGSADGQVVYANYGRPEDFATLEKLGIDLRDKVVLVRYGEIFRGLKVRNAQKRGAKGILIYSDPADDGFAKGDIYPNGPFRSPSAIQRGSVQFLSLGPGDPSTPFGPSVKGAKRLPFDQFYGFPLAFPKEQSHFHQEMSQEEWEKTTGLVRSDYFATIPSLPISYDSARPILEALAGAAAPNGWQGGLPFAYHVGPGPAEVHMSTDTNYQIRPIWNVIATLKGSVEPDRWVMLSNHRDAWVYGAVDPGSGTAATLETCRALGEAVKQGWKPRRSIVYASWDAEEYGLVGSTEWAEEHAKEIDEKAVLMLNVDSAVGGQDIDIDGIPSLRDWVLDSLGAITDPRSGRSLRQIFIDKRRAQWASQAPLDLPDPLWDEPRGNSSKPSGHPAKFSPKLDSLGSGSDYTAFLDHLGVPAADIGFGGRYGVYHSTYDNFTWMERFGDPEFLTHAMAARLYTVLLMRAAAADVLPFTFVPYAEAFRDEVDDLRRIVERRLKANDKEPGKDGQSFEGLRSLVDAIKQFQSQAESLDEATRALVKREDISREELAKVNNALNRVERSFLLKEGLPGRPWFKHAIYAPGVTTGYASWPLPGVRQAILDGNNDMLTTQVPALVGRLKAATEAMHTAAQAAH